MALKKVSLSDQENNGTIDYQLIIQPTSSLAWLVGGGERRRSWEANISELNRKWR